MDGKTVLIGVGAAAAGLLGYAMFKGQATRAESQSLQMQSTVDAYRNGTIYSTSSQNAALDWGNILANPTQYGLEFDTFGRPTIPAEVARQLPQLGGVAMMCPGILSGDVTVNQHLVDFGINTIGNHGLEKSGAYNLPFQRWFSTEIMPYYQKYKDEIQIYEEEQKHLEMLYDIYGYNPFVDHDKLYLASKVYEHKYGNGAIQCDGTVTADVAVIDGIKYKIVGGGGERVYDETLTPMGGQNQQGSFGMVGLPATPWIPTMQMVNPADDAHRFASGDIWLESVGKVPAEKAGQVLALLSQGNISGARAVVDNSYTTPAELSGNSQLAQNVTIQGATYHAATKAGGYDASGNLREWYKDGVWYSSQELAQMATSQSGGSVIYSWGDDRSSSSYDSQGNIQTTEW
jgi:hypothetical protein